MPHEPGLPEQDGSALSPPLEEANTESFLDSFVDPQWGHLVPSQLLERTSTSLSLSHLSQWNS
jgi:hypothetical protein